MVHEIRIYFKIYDKPQSEKSGGFIKMKKINIGRMERDTKSLYKRISIYYLRSTCKNSLKSL